MPEKSVHACATVLVDKSSPDMPAETEGQEFYNCSIPNYQFKVGIYTIKPAFHKECQHALLCDSSKPFTSEETEVPFMPQPS